MIASSVLDHVIRNCTMYILHFYRPQRSWGNVMFLQVSVILLTGGGVVCLSACWDTPPVADTPLPGTDTPLGSRHPPELDTPLLQSMLGDTVNARAVRILLECILVVNKVTAKYGNSYGSHALVRFFV